MGIEPMTFALQVRRKLTTVRNGHTVDFSTPYPQEDPLSPFLHMEFLMYLVNHITTI